MGRRKNSATGPTGLVVVDKPVGLSSMDVVRRVRRAAGGAKTGHAGTLDPLATGVVVCCLGKATKMVEQLMGQDKVYETDVDLTAFTTTDDREGKREEVRVARQPAKEVVEAVCQRFVGLIEQQPPAYSAIHVNGQRAYKLARQGKEVDIPTRNVHVHSIEVLSYDWPILRLRITCGKGTYIRSLGRDIGEALGTGGHLASLRRTRSGDFRVEDAYTIDQIEAGEFQVQPVQI